MARDRVIGELARHLTVDRITTMHFHDIAEVDPDTQFVEARNPVRFADGHCVTLDDACVRAIEDYLNAQPPGRPFLDFRPDVGCFLFPSPRTGLALSKWALRRALRNGIAAPVENAS